MASIFTYDPDPPRILSPWLVESETLTATREPSLSNRTTPRLGGLDMPQITNIADHGVTYLDAEPQTGPVEYKLHLLLRPRQHLTFSSTGNPNTNPRALPTPEQGLRLPTTVSVDSNDVSKVTMRHGSSGNAPSMHTRQNRLQHLTTQLLWRLQQSSPYHASSTAHLVVPNLPDASSGRLNIPRRPENPLPGIEESQGAMYEIGVNDDGALIGLTRDEMSESLTNLRAMAASIGCNVKIMRAVIVGQCRRGPPTVTSSSAPTPRFGATGTGVSSYSSVMEDLFVVEVLVLPATAVNAHGKLSEIVESQTTKSCRNDVTKGAANQETEQMRISLTGSTTSGKSSLLGTLLASTLDNARGKSRLTLLKHRHEIASGVTSSVAHELLGYSKVDGDIINYACANVESWTDMHNMAEGGRLVLSTDSAGHPRFRRTIVRSLIAWHPHWTLCCIASIYAPQESHFESSERNVQDRGEEDANSAASLAIAHLELCLKMNLPLVVVITKYDLATRHGLRETLSRVLTALKAAGRKPYIMTPPDAIRHEKDLQAIPRTDMHEVKRMMESNKSNHTALVPVVFTSAVTGAGITKLHALLQGLPLPLNVGISLPPSDHHVGLSDQPQVLFDVDEVFVKHPSKSTQPKERIFVLSGLLHRGAVSIGDELLLGPFSESLWTNDPRPPLDGRRAASYPVTDHEIAMRSAAGRGPRRRRSSDDLTNVRPNANAENDNVLGTEASEWHRVRVVSLRNLRLPVQSSFEGQAATVGIVFETEIEPKMGPRKGMVLMRENHQGDNSLVQVMSCSAFQVSFEIKAYPMMEPGARFFVYIGCIRAQVKVVTVGLAVPNNDRTEQDEDVFRLDSTGPQNDALHESSREGKYTNIEVFFQLLGSREYIEVGSKALLMPEQGGEGTGGLDGCVGSIIAVHG